jgi:hypothetical protein
MVAVSRFNRDISRIIVYLSSNKEVTEKYRNKSFEAL